VVFDTQGTYARFSLGRQNASTSAEVRPARIHLIAGESLRLGVQHLAVDALVTILRQFALPKATARYFASQVTRRLLPSKPPTDAAPYQSFLSIDDLLHLAQDLESEGHAVVGGATLSCLETIKQARIFATQPAEATAFWDGCAQVQHGGALVIDLSRLPRRAHAGVVQAFVSLLTQITEREIAAEPTLVPFLFFDDARPVATRSFIADVVTPARQMGFTSFFVTTHVATIEESLLHEADNLFLLQMASDVDVRHLAKSSVVDAETLRVIVRRLPRYHSMLIGSATGSYPIIFAVEALTEAEMPVRRPAFSRRRAGVRLDPTLPLFPDDTPALAVSPQPREQQRMTATSQPPTPTIAQVTATWDRVVKRVARRRRILETILVAARPLRMAGPKLILGFPPQHRFQQELIESEEYRSLLEDELRNTFGMNLEVATELHPA
jgi:hypothetical protein